jgi:hypothetical protein
VIGPTVTQDIRREVLLYYGGQCVCPGCGTTDLAQLELDHINGGGNAQRRAMKRQGGSFYRDVATRIAQGDPPADLQILCRRCNLSKGSGPACTLAHVLDENAEVVSGDTSGMLDDASAGGVEGNTDVADESLVQINPRVKASTRQWIRDQGVAAGEVIDQLVAEKRNGEPTILAKLTVMAREMREHFTRLELDLGECRATRPIPSEQDCHDHHHSAHTDDPLLRQWIAEEAADATPDSAPVTHQISWWRRAVRRVVLGY